MAIEHLHRRETISIECLHRVETISIERLHRGETISIERQTLSPPMVSEWIISLAFLATNTTLLWFIYLNLIIKDEIYMTESDSVGQDPRRVV